jgi:hypothetical protein
MSRRVAFFLLTVGVAVAAAVVMTGVASSGHVRVAKCRGEERWSIKTLTDSEAGQVNTTTTGATVGELRANDTRPDKVSSKGTRIRPVEFRRYRVHASLRKAIREDDGDLHVVISDPSHDGEADPQETMIIEFPDTTCAPQSSSAYAPQMAAARASFVALVKRCTGYQGTFGSLRAFRLHATVTGVGFWDVKHSTPQLGHALNDLELHPVLKLTQAACA